MYSNFPTAAVGGLKMIYGVFYMIDIFVANIINEKGTWKDILDVVFSKLLVYSLIYVIYGMFIN